MKIGGSYPHSIKQLGQQHICFIEDELQKRGIIIKKGNIRHTLKFSGGWDIAFMGEEFHLKISVTGTALTYSHPKSYLSNYGYPSATIRDFDDLVTKLKVEVLKSQACPLNASP